MGNGISPREMGPAGYVRRQADQLDGLVDQIDGAMDGVHVVVNRLRELADQLAHSTPTWAATARASGYLEALRRVSLLAHGVRDGDVEGMANALASIRSTVDAAFNTPHHAAAVTVNKNPDREQHPKE